MSMIREAPFMGYEADPDAQEAAADLLMGQFKSLHSPKILQLSSAAASIF